MTTRRQTREHQRQAGMWSTIAAAVKAGWGDTARLLLILALLGVLFVAFALAAGESEIYYALRALLAASR